MTLFLTAILILRKKLILSKKTREETVPDEDESEEIIMEVENIPLKIDLPKVDLENFNWNISGKKDDSYSAEERNELEAIYDKTLSTIIVNEVVDGKVVSMNKREVVVNIGYKSEGVVSLNEFRYNPDLKVGDIVEVYVESQEDKKGQLIFRIKKHGQCVHGTELMKPLKMMK